jgi:hypothetical protein
VIRDVVGGTLSRHLSAACVRAHAHAYLRAGERDPALSPSYAESDERVEAVCHVTSVRSFAAGRRPVDETSPCRRTSGQVFRTTGAQARWALRTAFSSPPRSQMLPIRGCLTRLTIKIDQVRSR